MQQSKTLLAAATGLALCASSASAAVIPVADYTKSTNSYTSVSLDLATPITGDDSVYLVYSVDTNFEAGNPNGFDVIELLNSTGDQIANAGEAGGGNTTWRLVAPANINTGVNAAANPDIQVVIRVNQVDEEVSMWINPDLGALESGQTPEAFTTSFSTGTNDIDKLQFRGNSTVAFAYSGIALYTGSDTPFVPEPSSLALLGLGGLCALKRRRRSCLRP